jgi:DUF971 family protein
LGEGPCGPASADPPRTNIAPPPTLAGPRHVAAYNAAVTSTPVAASTVPRRIHADRQARTLEIDWADEHHTIFDFVALRWLCPCAFCRGEAGLPGWLDSRPTLTDEQTRMVDIQLVGNYAVAPSWADGHHTGYYTYAMLRERCPCPEDTARRNASDSTASSGHLAHAPESAAEARPEPPSQTEEHR